MTAVQETEMTEKKELEPRFGEVEKVDEADPIVIPEADKEKATPKKEPKPTKKIVMEKKKSNIVSGTKTTGKDTM